MSDSSFINSLCAHDVFKRSTHKKCIRKFFWRSGWSFGTNLAGCWQLKNKKNSPSTINYHLLFDVHTIARERERERERERKRERESVRVYEQTQWDTPRFSLTELAECKLLTTDRLANWLLFHNLHIYIYINSGIRWSVILLLNHCVISQVSKIYCFYFSNQTCHRKYMNSFYLLFSLLLLSVMYSLLTYISAQLKSTWPTQAR